MLLSHVTHDYVPPLCLGFFRFVFNTALGSDGQGQTSFSSVFFDFLILFEFLSFFSSSGACFYVTCVRLGASMPALLWRARGRL